MAKLRNMASAPAKDDAWRKSRIGAIKARSKNQLGDPDAYKPYIKKNFKAESLAALSTGQVRPVSTYIWRTTSSPMSRRNGPGKIPGPLIFHCPLIAG